MIALLAAVYVGSVVHPVAVAVAGAVLGGVLEQVALGLGGPVVADAPVVRIGPIPGGYVRFEGATEPDGAYNQLAPWRRALVPLAGPAAVLTLAAVFLGPAGAVREASEAPAELLLVSNKLVAVHAIEAASQLLRGSALVGFGTVLAKVAAFNLLPVPGLAAWDAAFAFAPAAPWVPRVRVAGTVVTTLGALFIAACWVDAMVGWWSA